MTDYDPAQYGRAVKNGYDTLYPGDDLSSRSAAALIAELTDEREPRAFVEFGIGTGRLALGVQGNGLAVAGIDGSEEMISRLRAKPGGDRPAIVIGDYRDARVPGRFSTAAIVFNGIFDPRGPGAQLDIFRNAAAHLVPGGYFVVESWVMNDAQRSGEWTVMPRFVGTEHVELQLSRYDIETNRIERTLLHLRQGATDFITVADTYASPWELDLMATVTGFNRVARYAGWQREPFTIASSTHVTIYRKDGD